MPSQPDQSETVIPQIDPNDVLLKVNHVSTTLDIYVHADEQDAADRLFEVFA